MSDCPFENPEFRKELREDMKAIKSTLDDVKTTLIKNTKDIEYHIKRTDQLEKRVEQTKHELDTKIEKNKYGIIKWAKDFAIIAGVIMILIKVSVAF